jgi:hypothetical protein
MFDPSGNPMHGKRVPQIENARLITGIIMPANSGNLAQPLKCTLGCAGAESYSFVVQEEMLVRCLSPAP